MTVAEQPTPDGQRTATPASAWSPLLQPTFRALWIAGTISNLGTWMHEVGEAWLMTSMTRSPVPVALLQASDSIAVFLLALPAGALADVLDRRRLALFTQAWMLVVAALLGAFTLAGAMTPSRLIGLTFLMGAGAALNSPVWQSITPELVPKGDLPAALTLSGVSMNIARAVGPAIGGLVVAAAGPGAVFVLNGVSFIVVFVIIHRWRREAPRTELPAERWVGAMRAGVRYVWHSPALHAVLVRTSLVLFCGSGLMALLPVFARHELHLGSAGYGALLGCMGAGALVGAAGLPRLRARFTPDGVLTAGVIGFAIALAGLAASRHVVVAGAAMLVGGAAWMTMITSLNVAVQLATPPWVRARVLAVFLLVLQGALAGGSTTWGLLARGGIRRTFLYAGGALLAGLVARVWFPLEGNVPDLSPSSHWPDPTVVREPGPDDGPVLVTVEYRVAPERRRAFIDGARALESRQRRDGAYYWELFDDPATPDRLLEIFLVESWNEHMRQHDRATVADLAADQALYALVVTGTRPVVTHLIAARNVGRS